MRFGSVIAWAAVVPLLVAATQPIRLQPSSRWVLDYAENSCRMSRIFGRGKDTVIFLLESDAPGQMDMLVIGRPFDGHSDQVPARFLPAQQKTMQGLTAEATSTGDPSILWTNVSWLPDDVRAEVEKESAAHKAKAGVRPPPRDLVEEAMRNSQRQDFAARINALEIDVHHDRPVILETGSLGEAIKMFDKCSRDSLRDWGVDPDLEDKIVRPAWPSNVRVWFSPTDYPADMLKRGEQSVVKVRLLVDAAGRITKCTSLSHFKAPEFNQIVCANIIRRARFEPAELTDGTKVPSYYATQVQWKIGF